MLEFVKKHQKQIGIIVTIFIVSAIFHDRANHMDFHKGMDGFLLYLFVGTCNAIDGFRDSLCYFGGELLTIPEKMGGCPFFEAPLGWIMGVGTMIVVSIVNSLKYWFMEHILTPEFAWTVLIGVIVFIAASAKGGVQAAPASGGHGGGGGGHH